MAEGVATGRIDTVRPEHTPEAMGRPPRVDDHGGEVYVYRRTGQPCHVCGATVRTEVLVGRNLFWCPRCQPRFRSRARYSDTAGMNRSDPDRLPSAGDSAARSARDAPWARPRAETCCAGRSWSLLTVRSAASLVAVWPRLLAADRCWCCRWCSAQPGPRAAPPAVVRGVRAGRAAGRAVVVDQQPELDLAHRRSAVVVIFVRRLHHPADVVPALPARRRRARMGESMLVDLRDRIHEPGHAARAARRAGTPSRRCARPAARRSPATSWSPPARRRATGSSSCVVRRLRQGRGGRHPRAAALRRVRRPARRAAAGRVPAGRQRLPAPPGLGRGVRHRDPPLPRPEHRRLRDPHRRPPAGRPAAAPAPGRWIGARVRGPGARPASTTPSSPPSRARCAAATR